MTDTLLWVLLGAFIGWNFPQPFWAVWMQNKFKELIKSKTE
jgi:hypothetical protein